MFEVENLNVNLLQDGETLPVVRDISFRIGSGKLLGLIGESGSGKTVTALAVVGMKQPPEWEVTGRVSLDGKPVQLDDDNSMRLLRGQDICFVYQSMIVRIFIMIHDKFS